MGLSEERMQAFRDDRSDVIDLQPLLHGRVHDGIECAEVTRQFLGSRLADMANTQSEQEPRQGGVLGLFQCIEHVARGLVGHAIEPGQGAKTEAVQVGQIANQMAVDQLVDQLLAQALDFHRPALRKMQYGLFALSATEQATGTTVVRLALLAHGLRAANRAQPRHGERLRVCQALVEQHRHNLRNHVTRTPHDDGIAHAHILAPRLIFIVQGRVGHRHAANEHRRQLGHRGQLAGAPDLHVDSENRRDLLLRRVFVRHGPTRLAADEAQALLQRHGVDLVDNAVDVKPERVAQRSNARVIRDQRLRASSPLDQVADRQAPSTQALQH
jgi:hypothetical protein